MAPPYAEVGDLETRLGRELRDTELDRAGTLLETVSVYIDLHLETCVDTIATDYPQVLVDVVCGAVLRELARDPSRDPTAVSVQLGDTAVAYRYDKPRGSALGPLTEDEVATLRRACGQQSTRGVSSVPLASTLQAMPNVEDDETAGWRPMYPNLP